MEKKKKILSLLKSFFFFMPASLFSLYDCNINIKREIYNRKCVEKFLVTFICVAEVLHLFMCTYTLYKYIYILNGTYWTQRLNILVPFTQVLLQ